MNLFILLSAFSEFEESGASAQVFTSIERAQAYAHACELEYSYEGDRDLELEWETRKDGGIYTKEGMTWSGDAWSIWPATLDPDPAAN